MDAFEPKFAYDTVRLQDLYRSYPKEVPILICKTENPAHNSCHENFEPEFNVTRDLHNRRNEGSKYKWSTQFIIEHHLIEIFRVHYISTMVMYPLFGRPDGDCLRNYHNCLHYCIPEPLKLFPRLSLHFLSVGVDTWREGDGVEYSFTRKDRHVDWHDFVNLTKQL